jgi:halocyanin-like protein
MDERRATRRRFLGRASALGITIGAAGCLRARQGGDGTGTTTTGTPADTPGTPADTPDTTGTAESSSGRPDFGGYLEVANNYDRTVVDARGQDEVTVAVGAGDGLAFSPVAVHVDNGATVEWEWTGEGGAHNVVAEDGTFASGEAETSGTYRYTFGVDGVYNYFCVPHKASGMLGSVVVGDNYPTVEDSTDTADIPASSYLSDVRSYDGYVDAREFDEVVVRTGADDGLSFDPPAIHVTPETNVSWVWTDQGGAHNVVAEDGTFESGDVVGEDGAVFDHHFRETGVTRYYCVPHKGVGMKGAVLVGGGDLPRYAGTYEPPSDDDRNSGAGPDLPEPDFGDYLDGVNNYDGEVVNRMGEAEVTVEVGAGDTSLAFGPAAVHVDLGATVVWEWTGKGGAHNVVAEDGTFDSGETVSEHGATYQHRFEQAGIYRYYCNPHRAVGMKGAVVVGTDYPSE